MAYVFDPNINSQEEHLYDVSTYLYTYWFKFQIRIKS